MPSGALRSMMEQVASRLVAEKGGGHILSDDRAPVELLGMRAIDALIGDELVWVRGIYEREGVKGLIERFA
jgi:hypothetical protein